MFSDKWNKRFMELAFLVASWSKDPSTKTGAVIVGPDKEIRSTGYNGPVRGVDDDVKERLERPIHLACTGKALTQSPSVKGPLEKWNDLDCE